MSGRSGLVRHCASAALLTIVGVLGASVGSPTATAAPKGKCTVKGTADDDKLRGTKKRDVICAKAGDDVINGRGGNDVIKAADGDDVVEGGPGDDRIDGEGDRDELRGGAGKDQIDGGPSGDELLGEPDDDHLYGGGGRDTCDGGPGNDYCDGHPDFRFDCSRATHPTDEAFRACIQSGPSLVGLSLGTDFLYVAESPGSAEVSVQVVDRPDSAFFDPNVTFVDVELQSTTGEKRMLRLGGCAEQFAWISKCAGQLEFPAGSATATWRFEAITVHDDSGHFSEYRGKDVVNPLGFDVPVGDGTGPRLDVLGDVDDDPAELQELTVTPAMVDTSSGAVGVDVRARLTDAAGFNQSLRIDLHHPNNGKVLETWVERASGDPRDAVFETELTLPAHSHPGAYPLGVRIVDRAGNVLELDSAELGADGFPAAVEQVGPGDTTAPELVGFDIVPRHVVGSGMSPTRLELEIEDDLSGVRPGIYNPFGDQLTAEIAQVEGPFSYEGSFGGGTLLTGTATDGVFAMPFEVPTSDGREFEVRWVRIVDGAGNATELDTADLRAAGFDPEFSSDEQ